VSNSFYSVAIVAAVAAVIAFIIGTCWRKKSVPCPYCGVILPLGLLSFSPTPFGDDICCPHCRKISSFPTRVRRVADLSGFVGGGITMASLILLVHPARLRANNILFYAVCILALSIFILLSSLVCRGFGTLVKKKGVPS